MISPFDGLRPPNPSPELRARVLAAAIAAREERRHWIDVVWESGRFRLALAGAFALAIAANAIVIDVPSRPAAAPAVVEIEGLFVRADLLEPDTPGSHELATTLAEATR